MTVIVSDDDFISAWQKHGSPNAVAAALGIGVRGLYKRRARLAEKGIFLPTVSASLRPNTEWTPRLEFERRRRFEVQDGVVIIFSDPHYLPDHSHVAQSALLELCRALDPQLVICGGDAVDGDTISRWDPTRGQHKRFSVAEELHCVRERFGELDAILKKKQRAWILGNHDVRLGRFVMMKCPELADMDGMRLEDWAPHWPLSWTISVNEGTPGMLVVRHRNQAGMLHMQAQKAGCNYAHGHLHRLNVHTLPTFAGYRYSIDCGSLADPDSEGFDYAEGNIPHCQGFAVLTYKAGKLLMPELCYVENQTAHFRGQRL